MLDNNIIYSYTSEHRIFNCIIYLFIFMLIILVSLLFKKYNKLIKITELFDQ